MGIARHAALGALIAIVSLVAMFLLASGSGQEKESAAGQGAYYVSKIQPASWGGQDRLLVQILVENAGQGASVVVAASAAQFPDSARWWTGNSTGATSAERIKNSLAAGLSSAGWEITNTEETQDNWRGYLVVPTGVLPEKLAQAIQKGKTPMKTQVIIYIGVMDGSAIKEDGQIVKSAAWPEMFGKPGMRIDGIGGAYRLKAPSGGEVWVLPRTPDEYQDSEALGGRLAKLMIDAPQQEDISETYALSDRNNNIISRTAGNRSFLKVKITEGGEARHVAYAGPYAQLAGTLGGPAEATVGEEAAFQIRLYPNLMQDENLEYHLAAYYDNGTMKSRKKIGSGRTRERWVGSARWQDWPESGDAILQVEDQYRRAWARAFVRIPKYTAHPLSAAGAEREFEILKDGKPAEGNFAVARRGGSNASTLVQMSNGRVVMASRWAPGRNEVEFEVDGRKLQAAWDEEGGAADAYARIGVPGMAFALLVYLALHRPRQAAYRIVVPSLMHQEPKKIHVARKKFEEMAWGASAKAGRRGVASAAEIAEALNSSPEMRGMAVSDDLFASLLAQEAAEGRILEWGGYYALPSMASAGQLRERAAGRALEDKLIENGIDAKQIGNSAWIGRSANAKGRAWAPYCGTLPKLPKCEDCTLVFSSEEEIGEFETLLETGGAAASKLWLAKENGILKLKLIGDAA